MRIYNGLVLSSSQRVLRFVVVIVASICSSHVALAAAETSPPVIPGLSNKHPLPRIQTGALLWNELRCGACHAGPDVTPIAMRSAPDLSEVGARVAPDYLQRFIANPSSTHAGTMMPDVLASQSPERRAEIATAITHYLVQRSTRGFHADAVAERDIAAGRALFHDIGCVACHSPRDENGREAMAESSVTLSQVSAKYSVDSLSAFLFQPTRVRPSGRMPDMKLTKDESRAIAGYLIGANGTHAAALAVQGDLATLGRRYFQQFNCTACHAIDGTAAPAQAKARDALASESGCLSDKPGAAPRFHLSDEQRLALREFIAAKSVTLTDKAKIDVTLVAFNCIGCHARDDYGGVSAARDRYFVSDEKELGDEARLPPQLTLAGAKLQTLWMRKVLFDGQSVRPYMHTRMPQFGEGNLGRLPDLLAGVDRIDPVAFTTPEGDTEKAYRAAGQLLVGDKGLNCIACHNFNTNASPGFKGLDLITTTERLNPSWFYRFLRSPLSFRGRIVMPSFWPDGHAARTDILNGNTDTQIQAIWYYLTLGRSARDPSGIHSVGTKLEVTDTTRTYRGRSRVAGFRGVAVGFPGGLSYAFDAETGAISALWRGDFVNVSWGGQGAGDFNPAARAVTLPQDLSLYRLASDDEPWPLLPKMDKEHPVNPDPLYPKNRGYQFKGYYFDDKSIPTFMYRTGDVEIEDRSMADTSSEHAVLKRVIRFTSPSDQVVWFRVLTGGVQAESPQQYATRDVRLRVPDTPVLLRASGDEKNDKELLLKLSIPKGQSTVTIEYELLN
ncbi:MAG: c-type cytochrome [Phycisphaera sp.]|nr:c-type cytochrome [Phycisphaera sp.]